MVKRERPPRPWKVEDLLDLGEKGKVTYLKAIPVLILEKWVLKGRKEGEANYARTTDLEKRLVSAGLVHSYKPHGNAILLSALGRIQKSRNLTDPILTDYQNDGSSWINLPYYEPLLQEYLKEYSKRYPEDYKKLFTEEEPEWEPQGQTKVRAEQPREVPPMHAKSAVQDEIQNLLAPLEQALRDQQQEIESLKAENQLLIFTNRNLRNVKRQEREVSRRAIVDEELRNDCEKYLKSSDTYIDAIRRAGVVLEEETQEDYRW